MVNESAVAVQSAHDHDIATEPSALATNDDVETPVMSVAEGPVMVGLVQPGAPTRVTVKLKSLHMYVCTRMGK